MSAATSRMDAVRGATVLITGGARGMGELFARRAVAGGAHAIALWDIDEDAASALASALSTSGVDVRAYRVDVSQQHEIVAALERVTADIGAPDILVNNAGIVRAGVFWDNDPTRDIEMTMRVNTLAAMWLTREVLPAMIADTSRPKRILNIASAAGTLANPNMAVYAASKWAMIGWSDSVRLELRARGHRHVTVTTFCPSYVSTGMFAGARGPLLTPIMTPRQATHAAWQGMVRGTPMVLRPWTVKLAMALRGILPTRVWDVVADKVFKVYSSMDHFTGRGGS
ncbi:SDR family NAD(P)-dependent oxidoreductase [Microbacterium sp. zg.Y625]|uniref:SDR family NAD(P)-dependent oxidoreductase n=1 Tax=Microbacterium jiangjiandongii TaxID=3049071 RepID=UPI00214CC045|nr:MULTISPECIES: SDR family NAD(P)-dependent oxidoreductase [unclassified Microbacterium]MCR2793189.1 SDR family NAD(P)-dependent oxidoreductase [Microbacterium sp. zg.Y625]MCR2815634.1 SDR family NAD(P)-dependent oxidoreductase [Microbacterium sp. zg.Y843]WIM25431.1 SDR family NAD(P)-dependent oxidoreductase [Microbacterium sp. zg-Y625]